MTADALPLFLVWSNQHAAWWRPARRGYTTIIEEAGRYDRGEAEAIVKDATLDGRLQHSRVDPVTGLAYTSFDEVLVLAPESTEGAW